MSTRGPDTASEQGDRVFRVAWTLFIGVHLSLSLPLWSRVGVDFLEPSHPLFLLLSIVSLGLVVAALARPDDLRVFALLLVTWSATKLDALPWIPNHILLALLVNGALLFALAFAWRRGLPHEGLIAHVARPLRGALLVLYFWVVVHKLNRDFFDPSVSCAVTLYREMREIYPRLPSSGLIEHATIWGTLVIEALVPLLLLTRRLALWGMLLGLSFHGLLALHGNSMIMSFSTEVYALYTVFLSRADLARLGVALRAFSARPWAPRALHVLALLGALGLVATLVRIALGPRHEDGGLWLEFYSGYVRRVWFCAVVALVGLLVRALRAPRVPEGEHAAALPLVPRATLLGLLPVLAFCNGLAPYLGGKTATNFAMFSNLRVEGASTNHLFLPSGLLGTEYQTDLAHVLASSDPELGGFVERGDAPTWFELR
ncbi:MAG TPA: hypothetical protein VI299_26590, partial [Polyangiales bacterium]